MFERGLLMIEKNEIELCDCNVIHEEIVNMVRGRMPEEEKLYDLAELFKVFGDSTRIKIFGRLQNRKCAFVTSQRS
jgi:ArsR family transcriptional regulator